MVWLSSTPGGGDASGMGATHGSSVSSGAGTDTPCCDSGTVSETGSRFSGRSTSAPDDKRHDTVGSDTKAHTASDTTATAITAVTMVAVEMPADITGNETSMAGDSPTAKRASRHAKLASRRCAGIDVATRCCAKILSASSDGSFIVVSLVHV